MMRKSLTLQETSNSCVERNENWWVLPVLIWDKLTILIDNEETRINLESSLIKVRENFWGPPSSKTSLLPWNLIYSLTIFCVVRWAFWTDLFNHPAYLILIRTFGLPFSDLRGYSIQWTFKKKGRQETQMPKKKEKPAGKVYICCTNLGKLVISFHSKYGSQLVTFKILLITHCSSDITLGVLYINKLILFGE